MIDNEKWDRARLRFQFETELLFQILQKVGSGFRQTALLWRRRGRTRELGLPVELHIVMADEPVSRILLAAIARHLTIIPLGRSSRHDSSSLPEGCSRLRQQALKLAPRLRERRNDSVAPPVEPGRLSPPIWPCTTRGFPCLACCQTSGGLLPHLFTLTGKSAFERR
jgi:hypothetical protein